MRAQWERLYGGQIASRLWPHGFYDLTSVGDGMIAILSDSGRHRSLHRQLEALGLSPRHHLRGVPASDLHRAAARLLLVEPSPLELRQLAVWLGSYGVASPTAA